MAQQRRRDRLEHGIAGGMAVAVVHRLEFIEIDIDQRCAGAVAFDVSERALELALKTSAIEHVGQGIDVDACFKIGDALARGFELRRERLDFRREPHEARP